MRRFFTFTKMESPSMLFCAAQLYSNAVNAWKGDVGVQQVWQYVGTCSMRSCALFSSSGEILCSPSSVVSHCRPRHSATRVQEGHTATCHGDYTVAGVKVPTWCSKCYKRGTVRRHRVEAQK